jgi:hypothetical protein
MIGDPGERLSRALDELYADYDLTEPMFSNVLRDAELVDAAAACGLTTATALDPSGCGVPRVPSLTERARTSPVLTVTTERVLWPLLFCGLSSIFSLA